MRVQRRSVSRIEPGDTAKIQRRNTRIMLGALAMLLLILFFNHHQQKQRQTGLLYRLVEESFLEIGSALDRYRVDNNAYPIELPGFHPIESLSRLTTPHSYLWDWGILWDPYSGEPYRFAILDTRPPRWLLISTGPNKEQNLSSLPEARGMNREAIQQYFSAMQYDPSNGIISPGDIIWMGN